MKRISCIDALNSAVIRTEEVLFKPFDFVKWIVFGFSAWLAFMGETIGKGINFMPLNFGDIFKPFLHQRTETSQGIQKNIVSDLLSSISLPPYMQENSFSNIFSLRTFIIITILAAVLLGATVILV